MSGTITGTVAAVCRCAMVAKGAEMRGFGRVAEWFKAAVLKTASREHRHTPEKRQTRTNPSRNWRVRDLFAWNIPARIMAQVAPPEDQVERSRHNAMGTRYG